MPSVFVYSASGREARVHYKKTIVDGVRIAEVRPYLAPDAKLLDALEQACTGDGRVYLWAGKSTLPEAHNRGHDERFWDMMEPGDLALAYAEKSLKAASVIIGKVKNVAIGNHCWPNPERPYDLIYFLSKPVFFELPVQSATDQSGRPYFGQVYQGLRRVGRSDEIAADFGSLKRFAREGLGLTGFDSWDVAAGQGYVRDAKRRKSIERYAVSMATKQYESEGYDITDTGDEQPYDLSCVKDGTEVRVEVKGTQGRGDTIILTGGEVRHSQSEECQVDLFVVSGIVVTRNPAGEYETAGGQVRCHLRSWFPEGHRLKATEYCYSLDGIDNRGAS